MHWGRVSVARSHAQVLARSGTPGLPGAPTQLHHPGNGAWRRNKTGEDTGNPWFCSMDMGLGGGMDRPHDPFPCLPLLPHHPPPPGTEMDEFLNPRHGQSKHRAGFHGLRGWGVAVGTQATTRLGRRPGRRPCPPPKLPQPLGLHPQLETERERQK